MNEVRKKEIVEYHGMRRMKDGIVVNAGELVRRRGWVASVALDKRLRGRK